MASIKKGLGSKGKGLEALINTKMMSYNENDLEYEGILEIDINKIEANKNQPRKYFDEGSLLELSESIKNYGMIQPIVVRRINDYYELIAGERRFRAAKIAGLKKLPAIIKDFDKSTAFEVALIENIQRKDLNPIEEAESFYKLQTEFGFSQEEIAEKVGKSRSAITNAIRLLNLDSRVLNFVRENKLSGGHAKALLSISDENMQFELAERVIEEDFSVRETEKIVKSLQQKQNTEMIEQKPQNTIQFDTTTYRSIENDLKGLFATKVKVKAQKNKGKIEIEYYSDDDLDRILTMFKGIEI
ncbi:MAG: ParB/RepB/Spo0J family partition protein [Firmicutes bacterium]|jgi:ParB family chromosome partitioning protein|nr:ParB/RepB/Spo0J family partition protein [Bacillota bacterium]